MAGGGIHAGDGGVRVDAAGFETVVRAELRCLPLFLLVFLVRPS
jgi:hypothetical protein